jgi:hypothetical protein
MLLAGQEGDFAWQVIEAGMAVGRGIGLPAWRGLSTERWVPA